MENSCGLSNLLFLKRLDAFTFIGKNYKTFWKRVYGGQVLAQSLHAANQTVTNDRYVHSLHGYFILAGDIEVPIEFKVENLRDGKSFCLAFKAIAICIAVGKTSFVDWDLFT